MLRAPTFGLLLVGAFFAGRATVHVPEPEAPTCTKPTATVWASSVLGYSTQYADRSWSAQQALGMPDVYPRHGDLPNAWASHDADSHPEWLELGYEQPLRISAVEIYETYNPGAISTVELITVNGERIVLQPTNTTQRDVAHKLVVETKCTQDPIAAVRINVASQNVEGWNEIDAVGLVACK